VAERVWTTRSTSDEEEPAITISSTYTSIYI
jgi:hypothetical protein